MRTWTVKWSPYVPPDSNTPLFMEVVYRGRVKLFAHLSYWWYVHTMPTGTFTLSEDDDEDDEESLV